MSAQMDNDKVDELISKTVNTEKPQFDAEKWKQKYPIEYQAILSRSNSAAALSHKPDTWKTFYKGLAAAAAVILVVGLLLSRNQQKPHGPAGNPELNIQSPAKIISMASMRMAYQRGGLDALDQQFRDTLDVVGAPLSSVSIQELLEGSNIF